MLYPGSGVVLDCIDFGSLRLFRTIILMFKHALAGINKVEMIYVNLQF